jgi:transcriptional regulator with XRE-family HTH domain
VQDIPNKNSCQEYISKNILDSEQSVRYTEHAMESLITLSEYVRQVMSEKGLTHRQVVINSRGGLSPTYVNDIVQGKISSPTVYKLQLLAKGLGVVEEEIFRVARGMPMGPENEAYNDPEAQLLRMYRQMPDYSQSALLRILAGFDTAEAILLNKWEQLSLEQRLYLVDFMAFIIDRKESPEPVPDPYGDSRPTTQELREVDLLDEEDVEIETEDPLQIKGHTG